MTNAPQPRQRPTWARFIRMVRNFTHSEVRRKAIGLFAALIALYFVINGLNVFNSYVTRDFMSAIERKLAHSYLLLGAKLIGVFGASTVAGVICSFCEQRLGLLWRAWQTRRLVEAYMARRCYFHLNDEGTVANPDEKISDDVKAFTTMTLSFVLMLLNGTFTTVAFSGVLWSISPTLFAVAVAYAAAGSFFTVLLGRSLVGLNYKQFDKEASFRAELIRVRENAIPIALQSDVNLIRQGLLSRLGKLIANYRKIISVNRNVGFFTTGYTYLIQIIPPLLIAPLFISGKVEFGVIAQSAMAFSALLGAFSLIVTQFLTLSNYTAVIERVGTLVEATDEAANREASLVKICEECGRVAYEKLTLRSSEDGHVLVKDLNISVPRGTRLLINSNGGSHTAEMALFRATAGMWISRNGHGRVIRPGPDGIAFLPERPYLHPSTLREALVTSRHGVMISDEQIRTVLGDVGLNSVIELSGGLDAEQTWDQKVSLSDQQLLLVARVLLANPEFAMMDRIATALSEEEVERVLHTLTVKGITYITVGKASNKPDLYDAVLELHEDGSWTFQPFKSAKKISPA